MYVMWKGYCWVIDSVVDLEDERRLFEVWCFIIERRVR